MLPSPWMCPSCHRPIDPALFHAAVFENRTPTCPNCGIEIGIARSYSQFLTASAAVLASLAGAASFRRDSARGWLLVIVVVFLMIRVALWLVMRPWLQGGRRRYQAGLGFFIAAAAFTMFLYGAAVSGVAMALGTQRDVRESLEMFSVPLAWISPRFLISHESSILDVCETILGNALFLGPLMYLCWSVVRGVFSRARPIELSISNRDKHDDE